MRRLPLVGFPALLLTGFIFLLSIGVPQLMARQPRDTPIQPVDFNHQVHVQAADIDCLYCHRSAVTGVSAGVPELTQCIACHSTVGADQQEIQKVRQAWAQQQPIDWVRIHRMPDHVRFEHAVHINAGLTCAACHGDVAKMSMVSQVRPLHMAECVDCHKVMQAPVECATCHY